MKPTVPFYRRLFNQITFYTKVTAAFAAFVSSAAYGTVASLVLTLFGRRLLCQYLTARFFYTLIRWTLGVKVKIENEHILRDQRPAVILCNHQSELDVLVIGKVFPPYTSVTSKHVFKYTPILGWYMILSGSIFLNRGNPAQSIKVMSNAVDFIHKTKQNVFVFPEGTRSYTPVPALLPLKKGAFYLAVQAQIPIIPVVVSNTSNIFNFKSATLNKGTIKARVLDPIPTLGLTTADVTALVAKVQTLMLENAEDLGYSELDNQKDIEELDVDDDVEEIREYEEEHVAAATVPGDESHPLIS